MSDLDQSKCITLRVYYFAFSLNKKHVDNSYPRDFAHPFARLVTKITEYISVIII
jgi:hypothetical protein